MRVAIFYIKLPVKNGVFSPSQDDYWTVFTEDATSAASAHIRMEVVDADNLESALDLAEPRASEAVMNTHEVA